MRRPTRKCRFTKERFSPVSQVSRLLGPDPLSEAPPGKIRNALVRLFDEELTQVLGAAKGERGVLTIDAKFLHYKEY